MCLWGVWALPLERAARFHEGASDYYSDTQSIDASNDLKLARLIGCSYLACIAAAGVGAVLFATRRSSWFLLPVAAGILSGIAALRYEPEEPIAITVAKGTFLTISMSWAAPVLLAVSGALHGWLARRRSRAGPGMPEPLGGPSDGLDQDRGDRRQDHQHCG